VSAVHVWPSASVVGAAVAEHTLFTQKPLVQSLPTAHVWPLSSVAVVVVLAVVVVVGLSAHDLLTQTCGVVQSVSVVHDPAAAAAGAADFLL